MSSVNNTLSVVHAMHNNRAPVKCIKRVRPSPSRFKGKRRARKYGSGVHAPKNTHTPPRKITWIQSVLPLPRKREFTKAENEFRTAGTRHAIAINCQGGFDARVRFAEREVIHKVYITRQNPKPSCQWVVGRIQLMISAGLRLQQLRPSPVKLIRR